MGGSTPLVRSPAQKCHRRPCRPAASCCCPGTNGIGASTIYPVRDGFIHQGDGNWWSTHSLKVSVIEHIAEFADQVGSNLHEFGSSGMPRWGTVVCESGNERHTAITAPPDSPVCGAALHALVHCPGAVHWMHLHAH